MARVTGLEPATSGVTGRHSNQLSYTRTYLETKRSLERLPFIPAASTAWDERSLRGSRTGVNKF